MSQHLIALPSEYLAKVASHLQALLECDTDAKYFDADLVHLLTRWVKWELPGHAGCNKAVVGAEKLAKKENLCLFNPTS